MILEVTQGVHDGINNLYAAFLTLGAIAVTQLAMWWKHKQTTKTLKSVSDQLDLENPEALINKIKAIDEELKANGGKSIKDFVMKTNAEVMNMKADVVTLKDDVSSCIVKLKKIDSQSQARLEAGINQSTIAQFLANDQGAPIVANDALVDLVGMPKPYILRNKLLRTIADQATRETINERIGYAMKMKIPFNMNWTMTNQKTWVAIDVRVSMEPIADSDGNLMWYHWKLKPKT